ncbi:M23 family metallopeptidase [Janibacter hoylei]|uniref:M23 family metallopeptidase n=1 Tax=Janibacter hoylei TaxID=364298 RepID=UPI003692AACE
MSEDAGTKRASRLVLLAPALVIAFVLTFVLFFAASQPPASASCNPTGSAVAVDLDSVPDGPVAGFGKEQLVNAAHIMLAADDLGLSRRDQQIGVMTAIGESTLTVLDHGDAAGPDSRGLFQQRDSWGREADRMDPYKSATLFFEALKKVDNRDSLEPTLAAHKVQGNRDPWHYERHWAAAGQIVDALAGIKPAASAPGEGAQANSSYDLGEVQPQTAALANTVGPMFSIKTVGGYRQDTRPDHPSGLAADFMVPLTSAGQATGDALAEHVRENAQTYGVEYIIWNQRIWNSSRPTEGWRAMADRGSATQNHKDHIHVTLLADPTGRTRAACAAGSSVGAVSQTGWTAPSPGTITSSFGPRQSPTPGASSWHKGADYSGGCGAPIYATNSGEVISAGPATGFGNWIQVDHGDGIVSTYGHMYASGLHVRVGDTVTSGQRIADEGSDGTSTGCHLHFEISQNGQKVDPIAFLTAQGLELTA